MSPDTFVGTSDFGVLGFGHQWSPAPLNRAWDGKEGHMSLVKRIAIAVGSLLALALAGGAHWKIP